MKRNLNIKSQRGFADLGPRPKSKPNAPQVAPETSASNTATSARRRFSLSSLKSTGPRTAEDIQKAIAQGRFAELKPEQA